MSMVLQDGVFPGSVLLHYERLFSQKESVQGSEESGE